MRSIAILEIIEAVNGLDADDVFKRQVNRLISDVAAVHGVSIVSSTDRIEYARRLLDAKVSKATVRDRLKARYDISRTHAYRIITDALNCPKTAP
jgi:hypothetical protein